MKDAFQILMSFLAKDEYGSIDPATVTPETELKDLSLDSLDMSCLICDLEEDLNIVIRDSDYTQKNLITVGDVATLIEDYMPKQTV